MNKKSLPKSIHIVIIILVLIEFCSLFLMNKSIKNKKVILDNDLKEIEKTERSFEILLQSGNTYVIVNEFPLSGYVFDNEKSGCIDQNGEEIINDGENIISYNDLNHIAELNSSNASYCYLYFNQIVNTN